MKATKVLPDFHVFGFHPNVTFHNRCPFFKFIFHNLPSQQDPDYSCNFSIKCYFQQTILAAHHCQNTENRNAFKMAEAIIVPRPINIRVPSKVDDHRPQAPLLLALLLSPSISITCVILFPSLLTFKEILTSKESCERKEICLFWTPNIRRICSQNQQLIEWKIVVVV